jgi:A/G-specific adenine glycosylase
MDGSAGPPPHAFARRLLRWYDANRRDLPWRRSPTPYRTLVSEVMLQQTRVDVVTPYFRRFVRRFPTLRSLARAPEQEVLRAWEGLGYYRRARNLRLAAIRIARNGRRLPDTYDALRALPGVGDYTAAAVAAIAFGRREAAVDGNVERVVARLLGVEGELGRSGFRRTAREWLLPLVPRTRPGDFAQAMMELGATVCSPRDPACHRCPMNPFCRVAAGREQSGRSLRVARRNGRRTERRVVREQALLVIHRGRLLVRKRSRDGLLGGMWGLPAAPTGSAVSRAVAKAGLRVRAVKRLSPVVHDFSHFRLELTPVVCAGASRRRAAGASPRAAPAARATRALLPGGWRWQPLSRLCDLPMGRADRLAIAAAGYGPPEPPPSRGAAGLRSAGATETTARRRAAAPRASASVRRSAAATCRGARRTCSRKISPSIP